MFDEIIVPVDGSGFGELALPTALGIACKTGGEVRIVTVIPPLVSREKGERAADSPNGDDASGSDGAMDEGSFLLAREEAESYHADLQKRVILSGCDVPISCHVEKGPVVEMLDRHAREAGADLLVMTTHGRGPLQRAWLGSVADGLLRRTPCPILAIRPREREKLQLEERPLRHILVTLDGSAAAREILPLARALALAEGARVTLFRVIPPLYPLTSPYTSHVSPDRTNALEEEEVARASLERDAEPLRKDGLDVTVETLSGSSPAEGILRFTETGSIDLIAMTTHGRGAVARFILGSVADKVIRGGTVPVLLQRAS